DREPPAGVRGPGPGDLRLERRSLHHHSREGLAVRPGDGAGDDVGGSADLSRRPPGRASVTATASRQTVRSRAVKGTATRHPAGNARAGGAGRARETAHAAWAIAAPRFPRRSLRVANRSVAAFGATAPPCRSGGARRSHAPR